jgi:hypothetical protein
MKEHACSLMQKCENPIIVITPSYTCLYVPAIQPSLVANQNEFILTGKMVDVEHFAFPFVQRSY